MTLPDLSYAARVRTALLLVLVGCGFEVAPGGPADARPDGPDAPVQVTWSVDPTSKKAVPTSTAEWNDLIRAHGLNIFAPSSVWQMQEMSGPLSDSIDIVALMPSGVPRYRQMVTGWSRLAIGTPDGTVTTFSNTNAPSLPDVSTSSMAVLMYYSTALIPTTPRSVLFAGSSSPGAFGQVDVHPNERLSLTVSPNTATGNSAYGTEVTPVLLVLDKMRGTQTIYTDKEQITPLNTARASSRGLLIGGANNFAPEGRWLYMAAWYGPRAEIGQAEATALLDALGW